MIRIFKKLRIGAFNQAQMVKYLMYALGEIILVIIGILIALQINNWNENQKEERRLRSIYTTIQQDIRIDTANISSILKDMKEVNDFMEDVLIGKYDKAYFETINAENFDTCAVCGSLIFAYQPFQMQNRGFKLLQNQVNRGESEMDSLTNRVIYFYTEWEPILLEIQKMVKDVTMKNLFDMEKFQWYLDYSQEKYSPEAVQYFGLNKEYKNKMVNFQVLSIQNYGSLLKNYCKQSKEVLDILDTLRKR